MTDNEKLTFQHYGDEREINATAEELEIFSAIRNIIVAADFDEKPLRLVRKSDNYVSAVYGDYDIARFKFTKRAKWVVLPIAERSQTKHKIENPADVKTMLPDIVASVFCIIKNL